MGHAGDVGRGDCGGRIAGGCIAQRFERRICRLQIMRMSEGVEWGLHCCVTLAWLEGEGPVSTARLAASFELPAAYLNSGYRRWFGPGP